MTHEDGALVPHESQTTRAVPAAKARRLPGKARPREEVLQEYQEANAKRRAKIPGVLWQFWAPDPDEFFRWRVQLDCDCITEVMISGDKRLPTEVQWLDMVHTARLSAGQLCCSHEDAPDAPYREISEWGTRREMTLPADPIEPRHGMDPEIWAALRNDEPHTEAFWTVTLSCGHVTDHVPTESAWKPQDGPSKVSLERQREMTDEYEAYWAANPDTWKERDRQHTRRMLAQGWPLPQPERPCYTCPRARAIVAYQRIGWLVPPAAISMQPRQPKRSSRQTLKRRLREAQEQVDNLREQLSELDNEEADRG